MPPHAPPTIALSESVLASGASARRMSGGRTTNARKALSRAHG
eukprot:CAMPEP_0171186616 /NCGR_PEP_ID=MMETSP0790-20130122/16904_1 /TAXON_ID=2925 /ORGANISM="Alexandrium catenella, Strain OF101" /LENGTH=42 /DNA_ID= /DNA_START= /DNA_END= /DNA_ORIENTATION=